VWAIEPHAHFAGAQVSKWHKLTVRYGRQIRLVPGEEQTPGAEATTGRHDPSQRQAVSVRLTAMILNPSRRPISLT
jgi:hypothetical protein